MMRKRAVRWTMPMMAAREAGRPRSAVNRVAIFAADSPLVSQFSICSSSKAE
ncbi:hypothetical protein NKI72_13830 [Mesorhizobium sp. M0437]|uniref:hypothetical protein n=1 Tax=Mesorhizobium sp. M0437 TaxID=2956945 RepID=UPI00333C9467